jgi:hypothetical protein
VGAGAELAKTGIREAGPTLAHGLEAARPLAGELAGEVGAVRVLGGSAGQRDMFEAARAYGDNPEAQRIAATTIANNVKETFAKRVRQLKAEYGDANRAWAAFNEEMSGKKGSNAFTREEFNATYSGDLTIPEKSLARAESVGATPPSLAQTSVSRVGETVTSPLQTGAASVGGRIGLGQGTTGPLPQLRTQTTESLVPGMRSTGQRTGELSPSLTPPEGVGVGGPPSIIPPERPLGSSDTSPIGGYAGATKKAGFREFWDRARNVIASQGEAGQQLASKLQETRDVAETAAGTWVQQMPITRALGKMEFNNFVDAAEGKAAPMSQRVSDAVAEWSKVREQIYNVANELDVVVGRQENYFPHTYDPKLFEGDSWIKMRDHLVKTGQAATPEEAARMLRYVQDVVRNRRFGNLEIAREVDLPDYNKTKEALFGYIERSANRLAQVHILGEDDATAMSLISKIGDEGYDSSAARNLFNISVGAKKYGEKQQRISSGARTFNVVTKLGLSSISNASQSVNTATIVGAVRTATSAPKAAFSKEAKDFALRAGVTLDGVIMDLREGAGYAGKMGKVGAPGFNTVEKFNRVLASWAGKDYAEDLGKQVATGKGSMSASSELKKMGLDPQAIAKRGGQLTDEERIRAARNIVERSQFKVDPQDLPGWASSPWGKMIMQFRTFSYNQSAFMAREVVGPALRGNVKPLARFLLLGLPVGAGAAELQNLLRNRPSEENPTRRAIQYFQRVGGVGLAGDIITGMWPQNSQYLPADRYATMAGGVAFGPSVSTAVEGVGSMATAVQGKPVSLERFGLKQIPLVGPTIKNMLLPYKPGGRSGASGTGSGLDYYLQNMRTGPASSEMDKYLQNIR